MSDPIQSPDEGPLREGPPSEELPSEEFGQPVNAARLERQARERDDLVVSAPDAPLGESPIGSLRDAEAPAKPGVVKLGDEEAAKDLVQRLRPRSAEEIPTALSTTSSSPRHMVEAWLAGMVGAKASDLILRAGARPSQRVAGRIHFLPGRVPGPGPLLEVLEGVMGEHRMKQWRDTGSADAALHLDGLGRFRLNAYKQMGEPAVVIRRINEEAPDLDELGLPGDELKKLALRKRGLMLVTGIAGSGKSTTLGGMIQHMNMSEERHVITLEDPVELLFTEERCVISQREVGTDCMDFRDGLRHALRQSPDVILIGEMRDAETVIAALDATETGHFVMSTLHTVNVPQTVDRILSFFPPEQHDQVRCRLADNLCGVLSQRLLPSLEDGGLVPAYELLVSTPHVRELLQEGKTAGLARVIEQGTEEGLVSFNQCLRELVVERRVELHEALAASDRPDELVLALRGITASHGRPTRSSGGGNGPGKGSTKGPSGSDSGSGGGSSTTPDSGEGPGLRMAGGDG